MKRKMKKKSFNPGKKTLAKQKLNRYNPVQSVSRFDNERTKNAIKAGPGKRGRIYYRIDKGKLNVKRGDIILESDGLYKVEEIRRGSSCQKECTVLCTSWDPKDIKDTQILKPKKV